MLTKVRGHMGAYRLNHLLVEIIALACALSNTGKDRETTCQHTFDTLTMFPDESLHVQATVTPIPDSLEPHQT
jgi:hypothetical protein